MKYDARWVQTALNKLGYDTGGIDGIIGAKSQSSIAHFKASVGLKANANVGPITIGKLAKAAGMHAPESSLSGPVTLPWLEEINKVWGLHEVRDNGALTKWLRSDGSLLGDPSKLPWCGDAVETAIKRALPHESFPGNLGKNPFWARNWTQFGVPAKGTSYGAVASFGRGGGGHVSFLVGVSEDGSLYRVRGGNQSNMVNDVWIAASRLLTNGLRWPATARPGLEVPAPVLKHNGEPVSRNEY